MDIIKYNDFLILEGKKEEIITKYKKFISEDILNFFIKNNPKPNSSYYLDKILQFYKNNMNDESLNKKVSLHHHILNIFNYFINNQSVYNIDLSKIKTLSELKNILTENFQYKKLTNNEALIYLDGEEYFIFSPKTFDIANKYGDHSWCVNREFEHFINDEYGANIGHVVQFINKFNSKKNFAIQYEAFDGPNDFDIWNSDDDSIYSDCLSELKEYLNENNCFPYGINNCLYLMKDEFHPEIISSIENGGKIFEAEYYSIEYLIKNTFLDLDKLIKIQNNFTINIYNDEILTYILDQVEDFNIIGQKNIIIQFIKFIIKINFNLLKRKFDIFNIYSKSDIVDIFLSYLPFESYLKKYNISYNPKKSIYELWLMIYDKLSNNEIEEIILNNEKIYNLYLNNEINKIWVNDKYQIINKLSNIILSSNFDPRYSDYEEFIQYLNKEVPEIFDINFVEYIKKYINLSDEDNIILFNKLYR
jgi:hypothetical protein